MHIQPEHMVPRGEQIVFLYIYTVYTGEEKNTLFYNNTL